VEEAMQCKQYTRAKGEVGRLNGLKVQAAMEERFEDAILLRDEIEQLKADLSKSESEKLVVRWRKDTSEGQWMDVGDMWELLKKFSSPGQRQAFEEYFISIPNDEAFKALALVDLDSAWNLYRKMYRSVRVLQFLHTHPSHGENWKFVLEKTLAMLENAVAIVFQLKESGLVSKFLAASKAIDFFRGLFQMLRVCGHVLSSSVDAFRIPSPLTHQLPSDGNVTEGAAAKRLLGTWSEFQIAWDDICSVEVSAHVSPF
jgi:hypothetical protein